MRDHYEVLGVPHTASAVEIRQAYRRLARRYHPDLNQGARARFDELANAYEVLGDPERRARYDRATRSRPSRSGRDVPRFLDERPPRAVATFRLELGPVRWVRRWWLR